MRILVAEAGGTPQRPVAIDRDAPFARIRPAAAPVHNAVHKQQRVAFFHVGGNGSGQIVHAVALHIVARQRVRKIRFMAAGDNHRRAVSRPDVGQRQNDVALSAAEQAVLEAVCPAQSPAIAAGMDGVMPARRSDRGNRFVNEQAGNVRFRFAAVPREIFDIAGMINQFFERRSRLDRVVQLEAGLTGIVPSLRVAPPFSGLESGKGVEGGIQFVQQRGVPPRFFRIKYPCKSNMKSSSGVGCFGSIDITPFWILDFGF